MVFQMVMTFFLVYEFKGVKEVSFNEDIYNCFIHGAYIIESGIGWGL